MPVNNLWYSNNYSKTLLSLRQYYKDKPSATSTDSESLKFQVRIARSTPAAGNTKDVKSAVPLKYLSNFWITLETPLSYCGINLILTWPTNYIISSETGATKLVITDTTLYVTNCNFINSRQPKPAWTIKIHSLKSN